MVGGLVVILGCEGLDFFLVMSVWVGNWDVVVWKFTVGVVFVVVLGYFLGLGGGQVDCSWAEGMGIRLVSVLVWAGFSL